MSAATKEKAAWVFVPPKAAQETSRINGNPDQQRLTNLICNFEAAGHAVHKLETGFLVSRWGQTRHCPDFPALVGFARQLGVSQ